MIPAASRSVDPNGSVGALSSCDIGTEKVKIVSTDATRSDDRPVGGLAHRRPAPNWRDSSCGTTSRLGFGLGWGGPTLGAGRLFPFVSAWFDVCCMQQFGKASHNLLLYQDAV